jgi:hypothetical protein
MSNNSGLSKTGLSNISSEDFFSIQPSDVAQLNEERKIFEEGLLIVGAGLIDCQFIPPSPDNLIGGKKFPIQRYLDKINY